MLSVQLGLLADECPSTSPRGVAVTFSTLASEERESRLVAIVTDDSLRVRTFVRTQLVRFVLELKSPTYS